MIIFSDPSVAMMVDEFCMKNWIIDAARIIIRSARGAPFVILLRGIPLQTSDMGHFAVSLHRKSYNEQNEGWPGFTVVPTFYYRLCNKPKRKTHLGRVHYGPLLAIVFAMYIPQNLWPPAPSLRFTRTTFRLLISWTYVSLGPLAGWATLNNRWNQHWVEPLPWMLVGCISWSWRTVYADVVSFQPSLQETFSHYCFKSNPSKHQHIHQHGVVPFQWRNQCIPLLALPPLRCAVVVQIP